MDYLPATNIKVNGFNIDVLPGSIVKIKDSTMSLQHECPMMIVILKYLVAEGFIHNNKKSITVTIIKEKNDTPTNTKSIN